MRYVCVLRVIITKYASVVWGYKHYDFTGNLHQRTFINNSKGVSRKQRTLTLPVHLVHAPSSQLSPELLIYFCYLMYIILVILCSLLCVCLVFVPVLHAFDFRQNLGSHDYSFNFGAGKRTSFTNLSEETGWLNMQLHCQLNMIHLSLRKIKIPEKGQPKMDLCGTRSTIIKIAGQIKGKYCTNLR